MDFFNNLINSLFDKKNRMKNLGFLFDKKPQKSLEELIQNVYRAKGEISALNSYCFGLIAALKSYWNVNQLES